MIMTSNNNSMTNEEIVFAIPCDEEQLQDFAELNHGRTLTDVEVYRIKEYWSENEDIWHYWMNILHFIVTDAMNNKNDRWRSVDRDYEALKKMEHETNIRQTN